MARKIGLYLTTLSTLLHSAIGQVPRPLVDYVTFNASSSGPVDGGNETYEAFRAADSHPNSTHSVAFNYDQTQERNWTWTLKVSSVRLPNATRYTNLDTNQSEYPPNAHVAYTTYDFSWPDGGSLNDAVRQGTNLNSPYTTSNPSCMYFVWALFPNNVSAKWDPSSSDCTSALGEDCVSAILNGMTGSTGCDGNNFPNYNTYIDACQDSFGAITESGLAGQPVAFGNASAPRNATSTQSGATFAWALSYPFAEGNETAFEAERERLRVVALSSGGRNQLLCNRAVERVESAATKVGGGLMLVSLVAMVVVVLNGM